MNEQLTRFQLATSKVQVFIKVVFLKVGEIDTINEKYTGDVFLQARWREPTLDGRRETDTSKIEWSKSWNPQIRIQNSLDGTKHTTWHAMEKDHAGRAFVFEKHRLRGTFGEHLELQEFPFDTQELSIQLMSELSQDEVDFLEDPLDLSKVTSQSFVDEQEWYLYDHVEVIKVVANKEYSNDKFVHPRMSLLCRVARRSGFFLWNIMIIMVLISTLSFATFSVSNQLPQNRLQLSFTLVLTAVTFKFIVNQSLPKISYLSYLDIYVLCSLIFLYLVCLWHAVVSRFVQPSVIALLDRGAFIFLIALYVLFHIVFGIILFLKTHRKAQMILLKESEYVAKAKAAEGQTFVPRRHRRARRRINPIHSMAIPYGL